MNFIYCLDENLAIEFENQGLIKIGTIKIEDKITHIFENSKDYHKMSFSKDKVFFMNKLLF